MGHLDRIELRPMTGPVVRLLLETKLIPVRRNRYDVNLVGTLDSDPGIWTFHSASCRRPVADRAGKKHRKDPIG